MHNKKPSIAVLVSGGGTNLQAIIDNIEKGHLNARICAVISSRKDVYALERAARHGIQAFVIGKATHGEDRFLALAQKLTQLNPDLIVLAGYMSVLPEEITTQFNRRIINTHPSLIPSFCGEGFYGLKVHSKVLERGCKVTGVTIHYVDSGVDTGPIIMQKAVKVMPGDTPQKLQKRVQQQEHKLLPQAIAQILGQ